MDNNELNKQYTIACIEQTKRDMKNMIDDFIDDKTIDNGHKQQVINIIASLIKISKDYS